MHCAGMNTQHISAAATTADVMAAVRSDFASQTEALMQGKPAAVLAKVVDGKVAKWLKEVRSAAFYLCFVGDFKVKETSLCGRPHKQ